MPLSRPYGVTRLGWRSHVSRETLVVVPLVFRAPCGVLAGRAAPWAAARPRAVRAASFARRVDSLSGQAPPPPTGTAARPRALAGLVVSSALHRRSLTMGSTAWPATVEYPCGDALVERVVGERCRVPATVCKKSAAHAGLRTCLELRRRRNSISGGQPSRCTWRRRAR